MAFETYKIYDTTSLSNGVINTYLFDYIDNIENAQIIISNKKRILINHIYY